MFHNDSVLRSIAESAGRLLSLLVLFFWDKKASIEYQYRNEDAEACVPAVIENIDEVRHDHAETRTWLHWQEASKDEWID